MKISYLRRAGLVLLVLAGLLGCQNEVDDRSDTRNDTAPTVSVSPAIIVVLGSSVAAGWVTSYQARHDLQNGYAARLGRLLEPRGYTLSNISIPGNSTAAVLARMDKDLEPATGDAFVLIGLSLGNERLDQDRDAAVTAYTRNLPEIVERCRQKGYIPVVGLCYPYDRYDDTDYAYLKQMNITIDGWGVPAINFLGAVDDGSGHFVDGCTFDEGHPDNRGHEEMFLAIVPSMFDALRAGKPAPARPESPGYTTVKRGKNTPLSYIPDDPMHSFAMGFSFRTTGTGALAAVRAGAGFSTVTLGEDGRLSCGPDTGAALATETVLNDGEWHDVFISHRYLQGSTSLYVDGKHIGETKEKLEPRQFLLAGAAGAGVISGADYRDWFVYRAALDAGEVKHIHDGAMFTASMEVYAPLAGEKLKKNSTLENFAWSTSSVVAGPDDASENIAMLEQKIEKARVERENEFVAEEKVVIELDPGIYDMYVGRYELMPNNVVTVARENGRLWVYIQGDKTELYPESPEKFFIKTVGNVTVTFVRNDDGIVDKMIVDMNGQIIPASRVD